MAFRILGISASLRNARRGSGHRKLIEEVLSQRTEAELKAYLKDQASILLEDFVKAGREQKESFDVIYKNLKKLKGNRGLSNSEIAIASALWSAAQLGAEIGRKVGASSGDATLMLPLRGVSAIDAADQPFDDPAAREALFEGIRKHHGRAELIELDQHINDAAFAETAARKLIEMMERRQTRQE